MSRGRFETKTDSLGSKATPNSTGTNADSPNPNADSTATAPKNASSFPIKKQINPPFIRPVSQPPTDSAVAQDQKFGSNKNGLTQDEIEKIKQELKKKMQETP